MDTPTFLHQYGFDLNSRSPENWIERWCQRFPPEWIPAALVEALHQGRYKATSVEQLLLLWDRRGHPKLGFTLEFSGKVWPDQLHLFTRAMSLASRRSHPLNDENPKFFEESTITPDILIKQLQQQWLSPKLKRLLQSESLQHTQKTQNTKDPYIKDPSAL